MKTLVIVCDYFLPGYKAGGPIVSISNLISVLSKHAKIVVLTKDRDFGDNCPYSDIKINSLNPIGGCDVFYVGSPLGFFRSLRFLHSNVIYFNSFFSSFCFLYVLASFLLMSSCRVIAPRGELGSGSLNLKSFKKNVFIKVYRLLGMPRRSIFHATSVSEFKDVQANLNIEPILVANIPSFLEADMRYLEKLPGYVKFVYLSRITRKKNLHLALQSLHRISCGSHVVYDIWGPIEDKSYWDECMAIASSLPEGVLVSHKGAIPHSCVSSTLSKYHALLMPTANENYGHAIVEAMLNGVLPIISDQTPWRNLKTYKAGWDINLSIPDDLIISINSVIKMDQDEYDDWSLGARGYITNALDLDKIETELIDLFELR